MEHKNKYWDDRGWDEFGKSTLGWIMIHWTPILAQGNYSNYDLTENIFKKDILDLKSKLIKLTFKNSVVS